MNTLRIVPPADTAPVRRSLARILLRSLSDAAGGLIREIRIRRDMRHLESLSDHILSDIGIPRGHIAHALRNGRVHRDATSVAPPRTSNRDHKEGGKSGEMGRIIKLNRPAPVMPVGSGSPARLGLSREAG